jgi:hypothetical protein
MNAGSLRSAAMVAPGDPGDPTGAGTATSAAPPSVAGSFAPAASVPASPVPTTPVTPTSPAPAGGSGLVPAVKPDMNSTGMAGFTALTNTIAGWTLLACVAAFLLSGFVFVFGPALGFSRARQFGGLGMIGALGVAALVGLAAGLVNLFYTTFGGT